MLAGEHLAGAPDSALHFVEDEQDSMLVAERAQSLQEAIGRHDVAAFALDRLDEHRSHFVRGNVVPEQLLDVAKHRRALIRAGEHRPIVVRERHVRDAGHGGKEAGLLRVLARSEGQRAHAAAMESAEETDEARLRPVT